ncbi:MAG: LysR family transcriptional regulator [Candidatus Binatia bacterium]
MGRKTVLPAPPAEDLFALRAVHHVATTRSFSAAARALGVAVSSVTRAVQRVEASLGARLFRRSTHGLSPTEAGRAYAAHVAHWLTAENAVREEIGAARDARSGTLRVTVPVFVAEHVLPAVAQRFAAAYPGAHLDVHASDDLRDMVSDAFDLAIRLGPLRDSTLRARRLVSFRRVVCAAPAFVQRHGALRDPAHLAALPCLLYGSGVQPITWRFLNRRGTVRAVAVQGPLRSNNLDLLVGLAAAGAGVARLPDWAVRAPLAAGRLVAVLPGWREAPPGDQPSLWAVHAADPGKDTLRRAFLALLAEATSVQ